MTGTAIAATFTLLEPLLGVVVDSDVNVEATEKILDPVIDPRSDEMLPALALLPRLVGTVVALRETKPNE